LEDKQNRLIKTDKVESNINISNTLDSYANSTLYKTKKVMKPNNFSIDNSNIINETRTTGFMQNATSYNNTNYLSKSTYADNSKILNDIIHKHKGSKNLYNNYI
jgi:hypothetical protein